MSIGGDFVGKGVMGCTFIPTKKKNTTKKQSRGLLCDTTGLPPPLRGKADDALPIYKLERYEDAGVEYDIGSRIRRIPIWKDYFAVAESICTPLPLNKQEESEENFKRCPKKILTKLKTDPSSLRIIALRYAGLPLESRPFPPPGSGFSFIKFAEHLIGAGALLALHGIVHTDLHAQNILVDKKGIPRFIDFNLAILRNKEIHTSDVLFHKSFAPSDAYSYEQSPPDFFLLHAMLTTEPNRKSEMGRIVVEDILSKNHTLHNLETIKGRIQGKDIRHMAPWRSDTTDKLHAFVQLPWVQKGDYHTWFRQYWLVYDSWAIGGHLLYIISHYYHDAWFLKNIHGELHTKLIPIVEKMCSVIPQERMDCVQALYALNPNHPISKNKYVKEDWLKKRGISPAAWDYKATK